MKIGIVAIDGLPSGKVNLKDGRIDTLYKMFNAAKKVYLELELITENEKLKETYGIICPEASRLDLVINDLEFVETRLERSSDDAEKELFSRFKETLDKEGFLSSLTLTEDQTKLISGYPLLTIKPVFLASASDLEDKDKLLLAAYTYFGYISFFTATEKDARAWSIKKGTNAWEASGCIHSDMQKGFIRAEVISFQDLVNDGSPSQARTNNHLRLENKDYVVRDGDYMVFRFNK